MIAWTGYVVLCMDCSLFTAIAKAGARRVVDNDAKYQVGRALDEY